MPGFTSSPYQVGIGVRVILPHVTTSLVGSLCRYQCVGLNTDPNTSTYKQTKERAFAVVKT